MYGMQEVRRQLGPSCRSTPRRMASAPTPDWLGIGSWGPSAVEVAAAAPAVRLGPELPLKLHQAPDPGAVGADVWLDLGGQLADGGQVDAEQLRALLQRRCDRPAQVQVVPGPHRTSVSNTSSRVDRERYVVRQGSSELGGPRWGRNSAEPGGQQRTAGDNEPRGQQPFGAIDLGCKTAGLGFHTAEVSCRCDGAGAA
jgi:hypothetical protein